MTGYDADSPVARFFKQQYWILMLATLAGTPADVALTNERQIAGPVLQPPLGLQSLRLIHYVHAHRL